MTLITGENDKNRRLDRILRKALPHISLPLLHKLLRQKKVFVDGIHGKAQDRLDAGNTISIPSLEDIKPSPRINVDSQFTKKNHLKKMILWEGEGLIAVNKPPGLEVHGKNSLETLVSSYLKDKIPPSLSFKSGPLHRLDKPSSGIIVFSASLEGARLFSSLMRERKINKTYLAIVEGVVEKEETWHDNLTRDKEIKKTFVSDNGKTAITKITPLASDGNFTLIKVKIETGRTHQIRAQATAHGYPLAGDVKYGGKKQGEKSFFLHAWKLEFLDYSITAPFCQFLPSSISSYLRKMLYTLSESS